MCVHVRVCVRMHIYVQVSCMWVANAREEHLHVRCMCV